MSTTNCKWRADINVWFPFMYSQKWNCYFQNRIIMFLSPRSYTYISVRDLYISRTGLPILCREICGPILEIYKSLTDTWMWKLGLRPKEYINGIFVAVPFNVKYMLSPAPLHSAVYGRRAVTPGPDYAYSYSTDYATALPEYAYTHRNILSRHGRPSAKKLHFYTRHCTACVNWKSVAIYWYCPLGFRM